MRIGVFTDTYDPQKNGVVVFLHNTLPELARAHEVVLFAPGEGELRCETRGGIKTYWVPAQEFPFYKGYRMATVMYQTVRGLLERERVDIVHCHAPVLLGVEGLVAAKRMGLPVVATYHTHFPEYLPHLLKGKVPELPGFMKRLSGYPVKKLIKYVFSYADHTTAPTRQLVDELRSYGIRNAEELPLGIDLSRFRPRKGLREAFRRRYGIPGATQVVLYAGRVSFEKKIEVLLRAFRLVEAPGRMLVIVGDGPYMKKYQRLARTLGLSNVLFTGFAPDGLMPAAYAAADIFVSPSDTETFGLTFVEAMAMGTPVIGANKLGAAAIIDDGANGYLIEPGDHGRLAVLMERLLCSPALRRRLGRGGQATAKEYSMARCTQRTLAIYRRLMRKKGKKGSTQIAPK